MKKTKLILISILLFSFHNTQAYANQDLNDKLFEAIDRLDFDTVKQTLSEGADPNHNKNFSTTIGDYTYTHTWSVFGMLGRPYRSALMTQKEGTPRYQEIKTRLDNSTYEIAKLLFENGAILRQIDAEILYTPVVYGNVKLAALFLEKGANPHQKIALEDGLSLMAIATTYNQTQAAELLEKHGAIPLNSKDILQLNLVHASISGDSQKIKTAIQKGADANKPDSAGRYALLEMLASPFSSEEELKTLLDLGADPNMLCDYSRRNLQQTSSLHFYIISTAKSIERVARKHYTREVKNNIKILLDYGAYVSIKDVQGMTPLHSAAKTNHVIAAKLLIKKGAKIYDKDNSGKMPIDYAQSSQMINILKQDKKDNLIYIYILLSVIVGLFAIIALLIKKKQ